MAITPLRLPRLPANQKLINDDGTATLVFSRWWQSFAQQIEGTVNGIQDALAAAGIAQEAAAAANLAADNANTAAGTAQTAAEEVTASSSLANSYVSGLTLSAADAGTSVTVTISSHTRTYATTPPTDVAVTGGSVSGVPYSVPPDTYTAYIYYDQPSRAGGTVSYQYSSNNSDVAQINDRHSVGSAVSPAAAGVPVPGNPVAPPGGSYRPSSD